MKKLTLLLDSNCLQGFENVSDYVDVRVLAAGVAKSFIKPLGGSKMTFSSNFVVGNWIKINDVTLLAVAAAPTSSQFVPAATLALTLAALAAQFQALTPLLGTYTVIDTNTSLNLANIVAAIPYAILSNKVDGVVIKVDGARFVRLSAGALMYYCEDHAATVAGADITNGQGSISVPSTVQPMFSCDDVGYVSVIAPSSCVVSAEWWG